MPSSLPINRPFSGGVLEATVCWMHPEPAVPGKRYTVLHANRQVSAHILSISSRISIETLDSEPAQELGMNDIGQVVLETSRPLQYDDYASCRAMGSFIFVDPSTSVTLGAGMLAPPGKTHRAMDRSGHALFFKIAGGEQKDRIMASDLIHEQYSRQGIAIVIAQASELEQSVLADPDEALTALLESWNDRRLDWLCGKTRICPIAS